MKTLFKKKSIIVAMMLVAMFLINGLVPLKFTAFAEETATLKEIDMYLIAGQSNAAGYSSAGDLSGKFDNVGYAGQTEKKLRGTNTVSTESDFLSDSSKYRWSVQAGLGASGSKIGPEYGMAKVLNERYTGEKKAFIFKTAAGGTSLLDTTSQLSASYGNWYPRSLWKDGYTPEINSASVDNDATGILYQLFVENFRTVYDSLVSQGYKPVVKGMAWMQGCTDLMTVSDAYGNTLIAFINDIRKDLVSITGDTTLSAMPFVIGEIAPSFQGYWNSNSGMAYMNKMHEQQNRAANAVAAAGTISADDLIIVDKNGDMKGTDVSHFSTADAVTLGERFANKILELGNSTRVSVDAKNCSASYAFEGDDVKITMTPDSEHYVFKSLKINGIDVSADVKDGTYTLSGASGLIVVEATFEESAKYTLTYAANKHAGFLYTYNVKYTGEKLSLKAIAASGYQIDGVTFNDTPMTYNEESGEYEIVVTQEGEIKIAVSAIGGASEDPTPSEPTETKKESGCSGSVTGDASLIVLLAACSGAAVLLRKRRRARNDQ